MGATFRLLVQAAALRLQDQIVIGPSSRVLVLGAGRLGMLVAATLALTPCELMVSTLWS